MTCYDQWSSWKYRTLLGKPGFPGINPAQPHLRPTHQAFAMTCRSPSSTLTNSTLDDVERHCVIEVCAAWLFEINEWSHRKRWWMVGWIFCSVPRVMFSCSGLSWLIYLDWLTLVDLSWLIDNLRQSFQLSTQKQAAVGSDPFLMAA